MPFRHWTSDIRSDTEGFKDSRVQGFWGEKFKLKCGVKYFLPSILDYQILAPLTT